MKSDLSDGMSNHSDFSNDSQNSVSTAEFLASMGSGVILANSNVSTYIIYFITVI